jgi:hypothetical protein
LEAFPEIGADLRKILSAQGFGYENVFIPLFLARGAAKKMFFQRFLFCVC